MGDIKSFINNMTIEGSPKKKRYKVNYILWEDLKESIPFFKTTRNALVKDRRVR